MTTKKQFKYREKLLNFLVERFYRWDVNNPDKDFKQIRFVIGINKTDGGFVTITRGFFSYREALKMLTDGVEDTLEDLASAPLTDAIDLFFDMDAPNEKTV